MQAQEQRVSPLSRLQFIDMFRGLVTLIMIEGHVTNSTVLYSLRGTRAFHYLNLLNGMPAPSFIFIAGFSIALVLEKRWDTFMKFEKPLWLQIRRLLFIFGVGLWLHLPTWSFRKMLSFNQASLIYFLRCDVLHLISLSLLITVLLAVLIRNKEILKIVLLILSLIIIFAAPFIYEIDGRDYLPVPLSDYINLMHGALFPIFPWAAYAFLGTVLCFNFLKARDEKRDRNFFWKIAISGAVMFFGAFALFYVPWEYHHYVDPSRTSPRHFMLKMGFIFLMLAGLWLYEQKRGAKKSVLNTAGQESLLVYSLHLIIVYGAAFTPVFIAKDIGPVLTYLPSFAITFLLISSMIVVALIWHGLKQHWPRLAKAIFYGLCAVYFIRFFAS